MGEEEPKGFVIRDRRGRADEEQPAAATSARGPAAPVGGSAAGAETARPSSGAAPPREPALPVTFSSFVFSLGTSALMFMGEQLDPEHEPLGVNLSQAKEIIDILSMLDEKTRGNLDSEEQKVLSDMLYALRLKYVNLVSGKPTSRGS